MVLPMSAHAVASKLWLAAARGSVAGLPFLHLLARSDVCIVSWPVVPSSRQVLENMPQVFELRSTNILG